MIRKRVVIAGLGDSGVLAAIGLSRHFDVVGISVKPALVSGQELGWRLSRPDDWARAYWTPFDRFRALDRVRTVHGILTGVDLAARNVFVRHEDGSTSAEEYDALVISTGVTNGFWRQPSLQSADDISADLRTAHNRLSAASSVIVVGGGAAAVSSAANVARTWPDKQVGLYFPRERALVGHHPRTWERVVRRLGEAGVALHPGHRASIPDGFACDQITSGRVQWSTGQPPASADAVLWTTGRVRPNTGWLPPGMLDEHGFVRVTAGLQVPGHPKVFAVGDVAATDPLRSSARNRGDQILAHNVRAEFDGRPLRSYHPPKGRWGSVLGPQPDGLEAFAANGLAFRFPAWSFDRVLIPWIVKRGIYKGVRDEPPGGGAAISKHHFTPHFEDVQAHYDLSDEFFRLFLDPTQTYSCAYFARDDMTLEEAQIAKIDLALGKLGLQPGMTLLDVGCGWGATMRRAIKNYDVNVVGLTLSKNQATHVQQAFDQMDSPRTKRVLLAGWEQFDEPVDRIVSIGAFEHFGHERYPAFFKMAYQALPADGVMLLHTIVGRHPKDAQRLGVPLTFELARFIKFVMTEIFPGGRLPSTPMVERRATEAGFAVTRIQSLQPHYAKTLDTWAAALHANKDRAIAIQSQEVYDRYMKYLTGCAKLFRQGQVDVVQFTLEK